MDFARTSGRAVGLPFQASDGGLSSAITPAAGTPADGRHRPAEGVVAVHHHITAPEPAVSYRYFTGNRAQRLVAPFVGLVNVIYWGSRPGAGGSGAVDALIMGVLLLVIGVWIAGRISQARAERQLAPEREAGQAWISGLGHFHGPFSERSGLAGSERFGTPAGREHGFVPTRLVLTRSGFEFQRSSRGGAPLQCSLQTLRRVDTFPHVPGGPLARFALLSRSAWKRGRLVLTTTEGRTATFVGTEVEPLTNLLAALGARLEQQT
jgi:hypothetical protein